MFVSPTVEVTFRNHAGFESHLAGPPSYAFGTPLQRNVPANGPGRLREISFQTKLSAAVAGPWWVATIVTISDTVARVLEVPAFSG
jgi:hypothetical protein